jgi:hypothetical protein
MVWSEVLTVEAGNILFNLPTLWVQDILVEIFGSDRLLHILLEVCPACKDKVEIKCMGPVGGKTPTEPKLYSFFSNLRHI